MRTLRQLDNEAMELAKARATELCGQEDNYFGITKNEIVAMQANARFGDKYREMYAILKDVEKFFVNDDGSVVKRENEKQTLLKRLHDL